MKKDLAPALSILMALACAAALALLGWQLLQGASLRKKPAPVAAQAKRALPPLPPEARLRSLRKRVAGIQRLKLPSGLELSPLLSALERLAPQGFRVEEIQQRLAESEATVTAAYADADSVGGLISKLEAEGFEVRLLKQSRPDEGGPSQVTLRLVKKP